jgi:polyphenol oxidase
LYFFERILGKLIDDPSFTLPFWNWDSPEGMQIPGMFTDPSSPLYDQFRNAGHLPPAIVDLGYNGTDTNTSNQQRVAENLAIMYRQMVTNAKTPLLFHGSAYRAGDQPSPGAGSIEKIPHIPVHRWVGDPNQPNGEDLGNLYSSARDPLFYCHHANVDRTWTIWKNLGGKDYTDPDWLNSSFVFYDENKQLVRVYSKDCLDNRNLGYEYQQVDIPWLKSKPVPPVNKSKPKTNNIAAVVFPVKLDKVVKILVKRPTKEGGEEMLVIDGIEFDSRKFVKFDVLVNDEDDIEISRPDKTEFVGSFAHLPHKHKDGMKMKTKTRLRLGLSNVLKDLDVEDDESVLVSLVPRAGVDDVIITGSVKIEFAS